MNYARIYAEFISDRLAKQPVKPAYFEKHHILPRSMGGGNGSENIIRLTAEDHIFAHLFLARWLKTRGMWAAVKFIFGQGVRLNKTPTRRAIRIAAMAKEEFAKNNSGSGNCNFGKPISQDQREKLRIANTGKKQTKQQIDKQRDAMMGNSYSLGVKHSDATRKKISVANTGRLHTDETKRKMSATATGRTMTECTKKKLSELKAGKPRSWVATQETRDKISLAHKGRIVSAETRAKQSASRTGMIASDEAKRKMSESRSGAGNPKAKPIMCMDTGVLFGCVKDAASHYLIPSPSLRSALNRNNGVAFVGGFNFKAVPIGEEGK